MKQLPRCSLVQVVEEEVAAAADTADILVAETVDMIVDTADTG